MTRSLFYTIVPLLAIVWVADAQTSTPTTTIETSTSSVSETMPVQITEAPETSTERRTTLSVSSQERLINLAANLSNRFDAVIVRLNTIGDRLESRINKMEAAGQDVTEARALMSTARTSLAVADANMSDIDALVTGFVGAANPREEWQSVRTRYTATRGLVRSAHADMKAAINVLRTPTVNENSSNDLVL